jgi:hypothetical protein
VTQHPERLPGETNPVPDADASMRAIRDSRSLGRESLAMGAGAAGGGLAEGGLVRGIMQLLRRWRRHRNAKRS